jgi:hypothetical protein
MGNKVKPPLMLFWKLPPDERAVITQIWREYASMLDEPEAATHQKFLACMDHVRRCPERLQPWLKYTPREIKRALALIDAK